jgi:hypothetical protein
MATFLELCAKLARESGTINPAPPAVTGQTGRQAKGVGWIADAWTSIQNAHRDWRFLQGEFSGSLVADQTTYSATTWNIDRFAEWKGDRRTGRCGVYRPTTLYDPDLGQSDEGALNEISYEQWRLSYDRGSHDAMRPTVYAIAPDQTIRFGNKPDTAYTVRGEYRKTPQILAANGDIPDMPSRFHDAIVWRAIMLMSDSDEAVTALQLAQAKYAALMMDMQRDLLPEFTV